jgi:exoribonuclease R
VQPALDNGNADPALQLLREIGTLRRDLEAARGGMSLDLPSQTVVPDNSGGYALAYDAPLPVEAWNAQVSLLAGMEAARIMVAAHTGIVRTVPAPLREQQARLRRTANALHVAWPRAAKWSDVVRTLDRTRSDDAAFLIQASHLLRGAGYTKLDASNTSSLAAAPQHAGVAAPYAHVTAPLRRLADRYANEIVVAQCAGASPPEWALAALDELVETMEKATQHDSAVERAAIDAVECAVLAPRVGASFDGAVVDRNAKGVIVQLRDPAVVAPVPVHAALGDEIRVTLSGVDPVARRVEFTVAPTP